MSWKKFPHITFGNCPRCGGSGGDDPDASGADVLATDTVGNGLELDMFRGEYICDLCKKEILADEESKRITDKSANTQKFLDSAGIIRRIK